MSRGWVPVVNGSMKKAGYLIFGLFALTLPCWFAQAQIQTGALSVAVEPSEAQETTAVTAVYGVTVDDYLPETRYSARDYLQPKVRGAVSRPAFDLPDAFYFIGGPVFLAILLRVLVIFLNGFEEKRKEEQNQVAAEHFNPE